MIFEHLSSIGLVATRNARSRHAYVVRHLMGRSEGAEGRLKWFTGFGRGTGHPQGVPLRGDLADCRMSAMRGRAPTRGAPTGGFGWLPHVEGCGVGHPQGVPLRGDSAGCRMSGDALVAWGAQALLDRCAGILDTFREEVKPGGGWGWVWERSRPRGTPGKLPCLVISCRSRLRRAQLCASSGRRGSVSGLRRWLRR